MNRRTFIKLVSAAGLPLPAYAQILADTPFQDIPSHSLDYFRIEDQFPIHLNFYNFTLRNTRNGQSFLSRRSRSVPGFVEWLWGPQSLLEEALAEPAPAMIPASFPRTLSAGMSRLVLRIPEDTINIFYDIDSILEVLQRSLIIPTNLRLGDQESFQFDPAFSKRLQNGSILEIPAGLALSPEKEIGLRLPVKPVERMGRSELAMVALGHQRLGEQALNLDEVVKEAMKSNPPPLNYTNPWRIIAFNPATETPDWNHCFKYTGDAQDSRLVLAKQQERADQLGLRLPVQADRLRLSGRGATFSFAGRYNEIPLSLIKAFDYRGDEGRDASGMIQELCYLYPWNPRIVLLEITRRKPYQGYAGLLQDFYLVVQDNQVSYAHAIGKAETDSGTSGSILERQLPFNSLGLDPLISPPLQPKKIAAWLQADLDAIRMKPGRIC